MAPATASGITSPQEAFGHAVGADYHLVNYTQWEAYLKTLASQSDRMKLVEIGKSSEGRTQYIAIVSTPQNLANLDRYQEIAEQEGLVAALENMLLVRAVQFVRRARQIGSTVDQRAVQIEQHRLHRHLRRCVH